MPLADPGLAEPRRDARTGAPDADFGPLDDAALEAALVDLGDAIAYAAHAGRRVSSRRPAPARSTWPASQRGRSPGSLRWALVAALLALLLLAGAAIGFGWRLPGLVITFAGASPTPAPAARPTPAPTGGASAAASAPGCADRGRLADRAIRPDGVPSPSRTGLGIGPPTTLEARRGGRLVPGVRAGIASAVGGASADRLPRSIGPGGEVVLVYPAGPSLPAASTAPVDDFGPSDRTGDHRVDAAQSTRRSSGRWRRPGPRSTEVTVNGQPGLWIAGAPHSIVIVENGEYREETLREVGNVLAWAQNGTLIRIELAGDLADAQAIAATMR